MTKNNNSGYNVKRAVVFLNAMFNVALYTSIFGFVWENIYNNQFFYMNGNIILYTVYAVILFIFMEVYGGFRIGNQRITDSVTTQTLSLLFTDIIAYLQICLVWRKMLNPLPLLASFGVSFVICIFWSLYIHRNFAKLFPPKRMIIVYGSRSAVSLVEKMSLRMDKYIICSSVSVTEGFEKIVEKIKDFDAVIICDTPNQIRNDILKYCFSNKILTYITPKISDIIIRGAENLHAFDTPLLLCRNFGINLEQRIFKRAMDIVMSALGIIVLSPVMLVCAAVIKCYDGGPVFYKQERLTLNGKVFKLIKFRSMIVNAESDGVARLASAGDKRITPVGDFMRKTRLDEIPQLFNILRGDMSVVGPRPERPEIARQYEEDMPEFGFRLNVKAGLTGFAQVMGKYNTTPYDKLKLDLMYIENFSLLLDIKMLFLTVKTIFIPESTEGISEGATTALDMSEHYQEEKELLHK